MHEKIAYDQTLRLANSVEVNLVAVRFEMRGKRIAMEALLMAVMLLGSLLLTACGRGGDEPVTTIDVDMTEHKFTPNEFTVPAGAEITINLKNSGKQPHEFQILVLGAKADEKVDKDGNSTKYWNAIAYPGESKSLGFTAPSEPGSYVIKCSAPGHTEAGMVGTLQVK